MKTAKIIDFDLAAIAQRIKVNYSGEQADSAQASTLEERKLARRKAIAEDLALVHANPPPEGFVAWVNANCPFAQTQAYRYLSEFTNLVNSPEAPDTPTKKRGRGRPKGSKTKVRKMGWAEAAEDYLGTLPKGWTRNTLVQQPAKREALEKLLGWALPVRNEKIEAGGDKARQIGDAILKLADADDGAATVDKIHETLTPKQAETFEQKLQRALAAQKAEQAAVFHASVQAAIPEEVSRLKAKYLAGIREQTLRDHGIAPHLTEENYKFLLRVLHPDREPSRAEREQGFTIVRGLETYMAAFRKHRKD